MRYFISPERMEQLPPLERHFQYIQIDSPTASHTPVKMRDLIVFGQLVSLWLWGHYS